MARTSKSGKPAKPRVYKPPIYVEVEQLIRPSTGELVGALVPHDDTAKAQMRERGFTKGSVYRGEFTKPRNIQFWRWIHALGTWLVNNHEKFENLDSHGAIKRLQEMSGVHCDEVRYKFPPPLNYTFRRREARSLAFDKMDEMAFRLAWDGGKEARGTGGFLGYLRKHLYGDLSSMSVDEIEEMIVGEKIEWHD